MLREHEVAGSSPVIPIICGYVVNWKHTGLPNRRRGIIARYPLKE